MCQLRENLISWWSSKGQVLVCGLYSASGLIKKKGWNQSVILYCICLMCITCIFNFTIVHICNIEMKTEKMTRRHERRHEYRFQVNFVVKYVIIEVCVLVIWKINKNKNGWIIKCFDLICMIIFQQKQNMVAK